MILVVTMVVSGVVFSGCVQEQQPAPKTPVQLATEQVNLLGNKQFSEAYDFFNDSVKTQLSLERFETAWGQVLSIYGNFTGIHSTRLTNESGYRVVYVTCNFSKLGFLDIKMVFDNQSRIIDFEFVSSEGVNQYTTPSYVNLDAFTEMNVTVGSGEWILPGTLSIPKGSGLFPGVVLVQGSGPNDRDESIGPNKPFKDLARGLASQGVVVLRFEKRTKQYAEQFIQIQNFTVQDEIINDVIAAVDVLNASLFVNHSQMFVLGHSLGGMLAPRIASQDHRIAGLVIVAGNTRPLEDLYLDQITYLVNLDGVVDANESSQIAAVILLVQKINTLNMNNGEYVLGAPKSYWADLATYDPVNTSKTLHIPMLILQGKRDYQVTMTDFVAWNTTFSGNKNVTLKTYPLLNHLFIAGTGASTNAEYLIPGHVAEEVVTDVATWIKTH